MKAKRIIFIILTVILILLTSFGISFAATSSELQEKKNEIDQQIKEINSEIAGNKKQMTNALTQINKLTSEISTYEDEISDLETRIVDVNAQITEKEANIVEMQDKYEKQKDLLAKRLVALYESGSTSYLDMLLSADSLSDFISKYYMIETLAEYDEDLLNQIGNTKTQIEAENCKKYLFTKFARALLGALKVTQNNPKGSWAKIPLQDFTESSNIDWSKDIPDIDQQLYDNYKLSKEEREFIEKNVQPMD